MAYPGESLVLMEDTTLTGHWLGKGETSVEIRWQDADNADEFRPESLEISVSVDENPENDTTVTVIHLDTGEIVDNTTGQTFKGQPFPEFMQKIIKAEGLVNYVNQ